MGDKTFTLTDYEEEILVHLLNFSSVEHDSKNITYSLPLLSVAAPSLSQELQAYAETRFAVKRLIASGFVAAESTTESSGQVFAQVRLTEAGEAEAGRLKSVAVQQLRNKRS